jgi:nitronate monooxygenase
MRMIKSSPASAPARIPTANRSATCSTPTAVAPTSTPTTAPSPSIRAKRKVRVWDKTCLCTHMRDFDLWTCGQYTYRLKDTSVKQENGEYALLSAEHVFHDYQFSKDGKIALPTH